MLLAIAAAIVLWWVLYRSRWGYEIRWQATIPAPRVTPASTSARNTVLVMMFSGALAGLAGMSEVTGVVHRAAGRDLARVRLLGDHRGMAGQAQSIGGHPGEPSYLGP